MKLILDVTFDLSLMNRGCAVQFVAIAKYSICSARIFKVFNSKTIANLLDIAIQLYTHNIIDVLLQR